MLISPLPPPPALVLSEPYPVPPPAPVITRSVATPHRLRVRRMEVQHLPPDPAVARQVVELVARLALSGFARGGQYLIPQENLHPDRPHTSASQDASRRWVMRDGPWAPIPYPAPGQR